MTDDSHKCCGWCVREHVSAARDQAFAEVELLLEARYRLAFDDLADASRRAIRDGDKSETRRLFTRMDASLDALMAVKEMSK